MAKVYPEVYYSDSVSELLKKVPPFRAEPSCPSRPSDEGSCSNTILLYGGAFCAFMGIVRAFSGEEYSFPFILGGVVAIAISFLINSVSKEIADRQFLNSPEFLAYQAAHQQWERERSLFLTPERLRSYRKDCYFRMEPFRFDSSVSPAGNDVRKGAAEAFFLTKIDNSGLFHVHAPIQLWYSYNYAYYPDIVLSSLDNKLLFDIEVDEPYSLEDGSPIHYIDDYGSSIDAERNREFVSQGFCIIRFSEKQVIEHPDECINYIHSVIKDISNGQCEIPSPPRAIVDNKWSANQASFWAQTNYRNSYLPRDLRSRLSEPLRSLLDSEPYSQHIEEDFPF